MKTGKKAQAGLMIFLCWLVYTTSYLGKVNYSANITQIIDFYGITKTQAGAVPTFFFFAYGVGQVINGLLCKKYPLKWMIFGSLCVSAAINFTIAVTAEFQIIKWLWLLNGITLSVLWPSLIRLLSENLPQEVLSKSSVILGTTVASGTLIIYALSSVYAVFDRFKLAFFTAAFADAAVAILWLLLFKKAVASCGERTEEVKQAAAPQVQSLQGAQRKAFLASVVSLCFCAVVVNLIKDGLTTWVPSVLKESFGFSDSISIALTLLLPIVAIFGNAIALAIHKKIPDYVGHCAAVFAVIAVIMGAILGSLWLKVAAMMLAGLVAAFALVSSLNSLITGIYPLFMRGKVNSGLYAGILNGFCYLGSTVSSYGLGAVAQYFGWSGVFLTLTGGCAAAILVWSFYRLLCKKTLEVSS